ncbi:hypothetical protein [Leptospira noguchii]|nr:hypothetical protein [Leptospira noguchii]
MDKIPTLKLYRQVRKILGTPAFLEWDTLILRKWELIQDLLAFT